MLFLFLFCMHYIFFQSSRLTGQLEKGRLLKKGVMTVFFNIKKRVVPDLLFVSVKRLFNASSFIFFMHYIFFQSSRLTGQLEKGRLLKKGVMTVFSRCKSIKMSEI